MAGKGRAPGSPRPPGSGRKKGTPNKRSQAVVERLEALKCDPLGALAKELAKAVKANDAPTAIECAKSLMPYAYPRLKAVDLTVGEVSDNVLNLFRGDGKAKK